MTIVYLTATLAFGALTVATAMPEMLFAQNVCLALLLASIRDEAKAK